jgi:HSP20 family molecular chaperone IbpA
MSFIDSFINSTNGGASAVGETRRPRYQVKDTEAALNLTIDLPGVSKSGLEITDENGVLRITGKVAAKLPDGSATIHRESSEAPFKLVLSHGGTVDAEKVEAELKDGVLRLSLAKAESAKPRKIPVG